MKWKDESQCICYSNSKIKLEDKVAPPDALKLLLDWSHPKHTKCIRTIRQDNDTFHITSFKSQQVVEHDFIPTFKVQKEFYHFAGSVIAHRHDDYTFLQIYFIADSGIHTATRSNINKIN